MTTSTHVERRRRAARLALSLSTILCSGSAAPALAQMTPPAPVHQSVDANGVDLFSGKMTVSAPAISVGQGDAGLSYRRFNTGDGWTDNLTAALDKDGDSVTVSIGGATDSFTPGAGGGFIADNGNGATLTFNAATNIYTYTRSDRTVARFSGARSTGAPFYAGLGRALDITQPSGAKLVYAYDSLPFCAGGDPSGEQFCGQYATAYRISTVTNSYGYQLSFSYAQIAPYDPGDPDSQPDFTTWSNPTGATLSNLARPGASETETFSQTTANGATIYSITDPIGRVTNFRVTADGIAGITLPGSANEDVVATYAGGRVTSLATPAGTWSYYSYDLDGTHHLTVTDPSSASTSYSFDNASQQMTAMSDALNHSTNWYHDDSGRVTKVIYPEGIQGLGGGDYTQYTYDNEHGNVTEVRQVAKTDSGLADIVTSATYSCTNTLTCNQPTSTTDANQNTTDYAYDPDQGGVLVRVTLPAPTPGATRPQVRYGYTALTDQFGGTVYRQTSSSTCRTGAGVAIDAPVSGAGSHAACEGTSDEVVSSTDYGTVAANNLLPVSASKGAGDGSLTATSGVTYDAVGNPLASTDPLGNVTRYLYDAARELTETVSPDPDGAGPLKNRAVMASYTPHGLVASTAVGTANADGSGFAALQQANTTYDAADRKVADSVTAGGVTYAVTQYSYDVVNRTMCAAVRMNLASLPADACAAGAAGSDGPDRITKAQYDALGRASSTIAALGTAAQATESVSYTADGRTASVTDGKGNVTAFGHDGFDRLATTTYPSPTTPGQTNASDYEQLGYDAGGRVASRRLRDGTSLVPSHDTLGRLTGDGLGHTYAYDLLGGMTSASGASDTMSFGYDALGRKTSQGSTYGGTRTVTYDVAGRRTRLTWADGFYVGYEYDALGEMTAIRENGGTQLAGFAYDDLGRRTSLTRANGTGTSYGYDSASRLTGLTLAIPSAAETVQLGYNAAGQIMSRTGSNDAYAWTGAVNASRSYAVNGLNQYTQAGSVTPSYDARGNTTNAGGVSYGYDPLNRLTTFTGGTVARDALGEWLEVSTEQRRMVYDDDRTIAELGDDGTVKRRYVYGPGQDEPLIWYEGAGTGDRRFLHADERGSIVAVTDDAGATLAINRYDEHGAPATTNLGRFQYTGQRWVPALGLYDYKARMYSPSLGRFMQTDPIGYGDGLNWYGYAHGDPVNGSDPSGLGTQYCADGTVAAGNLIENCGAHGGPGDIDAGSDRNKSSDPGPYWGSGLPFVETLLWEGPRDGNENPTGGDVHDGRCSDAQRAAQAIGKEEVKVGVFASKVGGKVTLAGSGLALFGAVTGDVPAAFVGGEIAATGSTLSLGGRATAVIGGITEVLGGGSPRSAINSVLSGILPLSSLYQGPLNKALNSVENKVGVPNAPSCRL